MSKYKNKRVEYVDEDGTIIKFDSEVEKDRYIFLKSAPNVTNLKRQVWFELLPKNQLYRALRYKADFVYMSGDTYTVEDVKGYITKEFKLKQKLFYYQFQVPITIYKRPKPKKKK